MTARTWSMYAPPGDRALAGANSFLARVEPGRLKSFNATPKGSGLSLLFVLDEAEPLKLISSSVPQDAWLPLNLLPPTIELVFNQPVDENSIDNDTFDLITQVSVNDISATGVSFDEDRRILSLPMPTLTGYEGPLVLSARGLRSEAGALLKGTMDLSFQISHGLMHRAGTANELLPKPPGRLQIRRLVASKTQAHVVLRDFLRANRLRQEQIVQVETIERPNRVIETLILWETGSTPHIVGISPSASSSIPEESEFDQIILNFSEPVSEYHLTGADGTDRVFLDSSPVPANWFTKLDTQGALWKISNAGLLNTLGSHNLLLKNIPSLSGDTGGFVNMYSWVVVTGQGGDSTIPYCLSIVGTGDSFINLVEEPVTCTLLVFVNGVFRHPASYTVVGAILTWDPGTEPDPLDEIQVHFRYEP